MANSVYTIKLMNGVTSVEKEQGIVIPEAIEEAAGVGTSAETLQIKDNGPNNAIDLKVKFSNEVKMKTICLKTDTVRATFEEIEKSGNDNIPNKGKDPLISDRIDGMLKQLEKQEVTINHTCRIIQQLVAENIKMNEENKSIRGKLQDLIFDVAQLKRDGAKCMPMQIPMPVQIPRPIPSIGYPKKEDLHLVNRKVGKNVYVSIL